MVRYHMVELCSVNHPRAEKIKQENKDLGFQVYCHRGHYLLILGGDRVWRHESAVFAQVHSGIYVFEDTEEDGAHRRSRTVAT